MTRATVKIRRTTSTALALYCAGQTHVKTENYSVETVSRIISTTCQISEWRISSLISHSTLLSRKRI